MKKIIFVCMICFGLVGCVSIQPATPRTSPAIQTEAASPTPAPTETQTPPPTPTEIPSPTATATPDQTNLAEVVGLSDWVDEFVHAFGGEVNLEDVQLTADQLTDEIIQNQDRFTVRKNVDGVENSFLVVNGMPIALKQDGDVWQDATLKAMGTVSDLKIGCLIPYDPSKRNWWGDEYHLATLTGGDWKNKNTIDFGWPEYQSQIAEINNMEKRFHAVLFPVGFPTRVEEESFTQEDLNNLVRMVVEFMKGQEVEEIIVANEVGIPANWMSPDLYWQAFGMDYVIQAFRIARETDPKAKLIYNDTANHKYGTQGYSMTVQVSQALLDEGLIDYVGIQMHAEQNDYLNKDALIEIFQGYPVPVVITEFDVLMTSLSGQAAEDELNRITRSVFDACLESGVCESITFWGENDSVGWEGRSTLRDADNKRKQAYYVALKSMYEHLP